MRTRWLYPTVLGSLLAAIPAAPAAAGGFNVTTRGDRIRDCSDIEVTARGKRVALAEESLAVPAPRGGGRLTVEGSQNGGIYVFGGGGRDYQVRVCKAAAADGVASAEDRLARIEVETAGDRLAVRGPGHDDWLAYLLITAPAGAAMDLSVTNGPLGVRGAEGDFRLRAQNGPISLRSTAGTFDVVVQNGPVSIHEAGGEVKVRAQNGPISVHLSGDWDGEGLDARAVNGPLSLSIDEGFRSAVVVEASGHSPWNCHGCGAARARRTWDDDGGRRFEYGEGPERVRLSTVNGPVSIKVE